MSRKKADKAEEAAKTEEAPKSTTAAVWEQVSTLVLAVAIALGIRSFVIEPYRIPSGSMFPTLLVGDHLFVNKFIYGIKLPFVDTRLPSLREPERGDVVVFTVAKQGGETFPSDRRPDLPTEQFVKRIIGVPGDRVELRGNDVWVNGERVEAEPLPDAFVDERGRELHQYQVTMGERSFVVLDDPQARYERSRGATLVEEGRYYMLGDNRDYSKDSRYWGTVRLAEIKGPAFVLYWSWDFSGSWAELLNPVTWWDLITGKMRWGRIGEGVG